jgi:hypothetical protein
LLTRGGCCKILRCFDVQREVSETILQPRKGEFVLPMKYYDL